MPYQPHTLVTFGGTLTERVGSDEVWQCGVRGFNVPGGPGTPVAHSELQALIDYLGDPLKTWFNHTRTGVPTQAKLNWVKAANIGPDGRYVGDPVVNDALNTAGGASIAAQAPMFCSIVWTWGAATKVGKATHGRIYLPNTAITLIPGTSKISTDDTLAQLAAAQELLGVLKHSAAEWNFTPAICSAGGVSREITTVRVGDVWDVQRRRKDAAAEAYAFGPAYV